MTIYAWICQPYKWTTFSRVTPQWNSIAEMLHCTWKNIWKQAISSTDQNCPCRKRKLGKALRCNGDCRTCRLKFPLQNDLDNVQKERSWIPSWHANRWMHQWKSMTGFSFPSVFKQLTWIPCKITVLGDNIQNNCYISPAWLAINYGMTMALRERKPDCCESRQWLNEPLVSWKNITWL